jgi:hypothetical protein
MYHASLPSHMYFVGISTTHITSREDCLDLLEKWEEKKGHCNMVTTDPRGYQNPKEVDVQVVT